MTYRTFSVRVYMTRRTTWEHYGAQSAVQPILIYDSNGKQNSDWT